MSDRPCSVIGFGVVMPRMTTLPNGEGPSPAALYREEVEDHPISVEYLGHVEIPAFLICVKETFRQTEDWEPAPIPELVTRMEWLNLIQEYIEQWGLRPLLAKGFKRPQWVHSPRYG